MMSSLDRARLPFLDGLRGWAALVVVMSHTFQVWLINPTVMEQTGRKHILDFINSTPLGVFMDGTLAVYVFFCVSGIALSYPFVTAAAPYSVLARLVINRYPRLTIPIFASCALTYLFVIFGLFVNVPAGESTSSQWLASFYRFPADAGDVMTFSFWRVYFDHRFETSWNPNLWTMQYELAGSFAVFALLLVLPWRAARLLAAVALAFLLRGHYLCGFFVGMIAADVIHASGHAIRSKSAAVIGYGALLLALALATAARAPDIAEMTAPLRSPSGRNLIATCVLLAACAAPLARSALECRFSLFLGRVSFSLYLTHLIVICSASSQLALALHAANFWTRLIIVAVATVSLCLLLADVFERLVEARLLAATKDQLSKGVDHMLRNGLERLDARRGRLLSRQAHEVAD